MMKARPCLALTFLFLLGSCTSPDVLELEQSPVTGPAGEWPQWRGPQRDGRVPAQGLLQEWREGAEPRQVWRRQLGEGFSSVTVAGGRAFTLFADDSREYLIALEARDGSELWRLDLGRKHLDGNGHGPRSTPLASEGVVYALSARAKLVAARIQDGKLLWQLDIRQRFSRGEDPAWGYSSSPLLEGGLLLIHGAQTGNVLALDRSSGQLVWSAEYGPVGYSSPIVARLAGRRQVVSLIGTLLVGLDLDSGRRLWSHPWRTFSAVNVGDPIPLGSDQVFISSGYNQGAALLRIRPAGKEGGLAVEEVWASRVMRNHFNSSVAVGGYLYGFDNASLKCVRAADGRKMWAKRGLGKGSLIAAGHQLIVLGARGRLVLAEATPEEYRERGSIQVLTGVCWTPPTLAGQWLYLRNQREIVCLNLGVLKTAVP